MLKNTGDTAAAAPESKMAAGKAAADEELQPVEGSIGSFLRATPQASATGQPAADMPSVGAPPASMLAGKPAQGLQQLLRAASRPARSASLVRSWPPSLTEQNATASVGPSEQASLHAPAHSSITQHDAGNAAAAAAAAAEEAAPTADIGLAPAHCQTFESAMSTLSLGDNVAASAASNVFGLKAGDLLAAVRCGDVAQRLLCRPSVMLCKTS